jgi:transposase, IS30 family
MISERPAEADDRAVPGHWEGDLLVGANNQSALGTLVERSTRFTLLLPLPDGYDAVSVRDAIIPAITALPTQLRRSMAWDQGIEMARPRRDHHGHRPARSTSATPPPPGNAAATRTPTGSCGATCPAPVTYPSTTSTNSTTSPPDSTPDHANASAT